MSRFLIGRLGGTAALLAIATSAQAQCPSTPAAWSSFQALNGGVVSITSPGLPSSAGTSSCKLTTSINAGSQAVLNVRAAVRDETPQAETRFRTRFVVDLRALTNLAGNQRVKVFNAQTLTPPANGSIGVVQLKLQGGTDSSPMELQSFASCLNSEQGDDRCRFKIPLSIAVHVIEIEWIRASSMIATDGVIRWWLNSNNENVPTGQLTNLRNFTWRGIDQVNMGLVRPNQNFVNGQGNRQVHFDEFVWRRRSFIGN